MRENSLFPHFFRAKLTWNYGFSAIFHIFLLKISLVTWLHDFQIKLADRKSIASYEIAWKMAQNGKFIARYMYIFKNAHGNCTVMYQGFMTGLILGLKLTAFALLFGWVFEGFQFLNVDNGKMMHRMAMAVIAYGCSGFGCFVSQFLSVSNIAWYSF